MGRLIKYELKGNYITFSIVFILMILLNLGIHMKSNSWPSGAVVALTALVNFGIFGVVLIINIKSFSKELFEDRGFLTFTLPITGKQIIIGKLIVSLIWFLIAGIIYTLFQIASIKLIMNGEVYETLSKLVGAKLMISSIVSILLSSLTLMITIYFSTTVSKVTLKNKKIGKFLGFIVFIALMVAISYVGDKLVHFFPQTINLQNAEFNKTIAQLEQMNISLNIPKIEMSIFNLVYNTLVFIGLFFGTSYLLENKIDL